MIIAPTSGGLVVSLDSELEFIIQLTYGEQGFFTWLEGIMKKNIKLISNITIPVLTFFLGGRLLNYSVKVTFPDRRSGVEAIIIKCVDLEISKDIRNSTQNNFKFLVPNETNCEFSLRTGKKVYRKEYYVQPGFDLYLNLAGENLEVNLR